MISLKSFKSTKKCCDKIFHSSIIFHIPREWNITILYLNSVLVAEIVAIGMIWGNRSKTPDATKELIVPEIGSRLSINTVKMRWIEVIHNSQYTTNLTTIQVRDCQHKFRHAIPILSNNASMENINTTILAENNPWQNKVWKLRSCCNRLSSKNVGITALLLSTHSV